MIAKLWLPALIVSFSFPSFAGVYHAGGGCKPATLHVPDKDVHVTSGQNHHGEQVVPADMHASAMDAEFLKSPPIALNLPLNDYIREESFNAALGRAEIQVGTVTHNSEGEVKLNNEILSTAPQEVYSEECK